MTMTFKARVEAVRTNQFYAHCGIAGPGEPAASAPPRATYIDALVFDLDGGGCADDRLTIICPESFAKETKIGDVLAGTLYHERPAS